MTHYGMQPTSRKIEENSTRVYPKSSPNPQSHAPRNLNELPHGKFHKPLCRFDRNWQGKALGAGQSSKKTMQLGGSATLPQAKNK